MRGVLRPISAVSLAVLCLSLVGCGASAPETARPGAAVRAPVARRLTAFGSEAELRTPARCSWPGHRLAEVGRVSFAP